MQEDVSERVVRQRIRNRIIENLELQASFESQREYEAKAPFISAFEVLNQWDDWISGDPRHHAPHAVLSAEEIAALGPVYDCVDAAAVELRQFAYPTMEQAQRLQTWAALRDQSAIALAVLSQRGPMMEHVEED